MQLALAVAEVRQEACLFGLLRKFHEAFAEMEVFQFTIRNLDLFVDQPIANAVHHIATFQSRHDTIPLPLPEMLTAFYHQPRVAATRCDPTTVPETSRGSSTRCYLLCPEANKTSKRPRQGRRNNLVDSSRMLHRPVGNCSTFHEVPLPFPTAISHCFPMLYKLRIQHWKSLVRTLLKTSSGDWPNSACIVA